MPVHLAQNILGDVLSNPGLGEIAISLYDIDPERLKTSDVVARRICDALGLTDVKVEATLDRRTALKGADYTVAKILYEVFPTEVQQIFPSYRDSFAAGLNRVNLNLVQDFSAAVRAQTAPAAAPPPAQPQQ